MVAVLSKIEIGQNQTKIEIGQMRVNQFRFWSTFDFGRNIDIIIPFFVYIINTIYHQCDDHHHNNNNNRQFLLFTFFHNISSLLPVFYILKFTLANSVK